MGFVLFFLLQFSIVDGDTVKLNGERIRVTGFDAPETARAKCPAERMLGGVAKRRLKQLLAGEDVELHFVPCDKPGTSRCNAKGHFLDIYRRSLARITIQGKPLARIMLDEGLARRYRPRSAGSWCHAR